MAAVHSVLADMTAHSRLFDKVDRARDVYVKGPLRRALAGVLHAYDEDKDELGLQEPSLPSLKGLLKFLANPHRADWTPPSLALNPEGRFVAIWDVVPNRYSVEFVSPNEAAWIGILRTYDAMETRSGCYRDFDRYEAPPFAIPGRTTD